jgi:hypothetical protein|tara:strand:+ start:2706 stop:2930 length:225 start_codon:yes stop_codon:yes gene_type:complete
MTTREELLQAAKDAKDQPKIDAAYEASLTSTEMAPKPEQKPAPKPTPKPKKMAGGGVTRADGCITKGHTKGRMV